jgi:predicted nucleotidyltransferase
MDSHWGVSERTAFAPPKVHEYLDALLERLFDVLHDRLLGVYVGGSLALGAYLPRRSDIDVAAIVDGHLRTSEKRSLVAALRHEAFPCPARGLELVVYPLDVVTSGRSDPGFELNLNTGEGMAFRVDFRADPQDAHWFAIDRSILAEYGIAVFGPAPSSIFAPIPRASLFASLLDSLEWHTSGRGRGDDAVLNAVRALRFAADGVWSSKSDAGGWALGRLDQRDVVERALAARVGAPDVPSDLAGEFVTRIRTLLTNQVGIRPPEREPRP